MWQVRWGVSAHVPAVPGGLTCAPPTPQMLSFMHAQYSFFQQGHSLLHQLDPYMKKLAAELDQLVIDSAVEKREMERKHAAIQQRTLLQDFSYDEPKVEFDVDAPSGVVMEGYLFKRASNAFKTWNR